MNRYSTVDLSDSVIFIGGVGVVGDVVGVVVGVGVVWCCLKLPPLSHSTPSQQTKGDTICTPAKRRISDGRTRPLIEMRGNI